MVNMIKLVLVAATVGDIWQVVIRRFHVPSVLRCSTDVVKINCFSMKLSSRRRPNPPFRNLIPPRSSISL